MRVCWLPSSSLSRDEDGAEAIDARLVLVAEVVGDQFQVLAVQVAAPDGAGLAVGVVARPLAALAVGRLQAVHALVADAEVELHVGADEDAVNAVIVVEAAEAGEQLLRRAVGLAVAVLVVEDEDVRRLADEDLVAGADRVLGHGDAERAVQLRCPGRRRSPCRPCRRRWCLRG